VTGARQPQRRAEVSVCVRACAARGGVFIVPRSLFLLSAGDGDGAQVRNGKRGGRPRPQGEPGLA
jgi:hypothetical protein